MERVQVEEPEFVACQKPSPTRLVFCVLVVIYLRIAGRGEAVGVRG